MFATNTLVIIVPVKNPADVTHIVDLGRGRAEARARRGGGPDRRLHARVLELAGLGAALENVVSLEEDVKGVVAKIALGEADAGFVYATDFPRG